MRETDESDVVVVRAPERMRRSQPAANAADTVLTSFPSSTRRENKKINAKSKTKQKPRARRRLRASLYVPAK